MQQQELARHLSVNPTEIVFTVTIEDLLSILINRFGDEALTLTVDELHTIIEEAQIAFEEFDPRDYLNEGVDAFEITPNL